MNERDDSFPVVTEGRLRGLFTGFAENDRLEPYPVFEFDDAERWQQDEPFYYYYGMIREPMARVIAYGGAFFLIVDAIPTDVNPALPRPVRVRRADGD